METLWFILIPSSQMSARSDGEDLADWKSSADPTCDTSKLAHMSPESVEEKDPEGREFADWTHSCLEGSWQDNWTAPLSWALKHALKEFAA